ncbi:hypothetical protein JOD65_000062 [Nocardioides cavernae]|nr:hypothetical protein [Nocardioides cavernae]
MVTLLARPVRLGMSQEDQRVLGHLPSARPRGHAGDATRHAVTELPCPRRQRGAETHNSRQCGGDVHEHPPEPEAPGFSPTPRMRTGTVQLQPRPPNFGSRRVRTMSRQRSYATSEVDRDWLDALLVVAACKYTLVRVTRKKAMGRSPLTVDGMRVSLAAWPSRGQLSPG